MDGLQRLRKASGASERLRLLGERLGCAPSDLLALAILLAGALAALGVLWWAAVPRPAATGDPLSLASDPAAPATAATAEGSPADGAFVVHVAGAVTAPGIYELPAGARVADALEAAGGPLPEALVDGVNLARLVTDGEQLLVPAPGDPVAVTGQPAGAAEAAVRPDGRLDLNLAEPADLEELPGIGPVLAERIVAHREANGPFASVEALREVSGIGEKIYAALADLVVV